MVSLQKVARGRSFHTQEPGYYIIVLYICLSSLSATLSQGSGAAYQC